MIAKVRAICCALDGSVEEVAWIGVRWKVKKKTYAHVLEIRTRSRPRTSKLPNETAGC